MVKLLVLFLLAAAPAYGQGMLTLGAGHRATSAATLECDEPGVDEVIDPGESVPTAITAAGTSGVVCFRAGIHVLTTSMVPLTGQTFTFETGAIVRGSRSLTVWSGSGDYYAASQTQAGTTNIDGSHTYCQWPALGLPISPRCDYPEDLFLDGVRLHHVDSLANCDTVGEWFFDYTLDRIYVCEQNPTGHSVETSLVSQATSGSANNVTFLGGIFEYFASPLQRYTFYGGSGWTFDGVESRWNHGGCFNTQTGWTIRNSYGHHCGQYGIAGTAAGALVEDNEFSYNGWSGLSEYWGVGGSKWAYSSDLVIDGNYVHHNYGPGFWTDIDNYDTVYSNNTITDNTRAGIFHEISFGAEIFGNRLERNGSRVTFDCDGSPASPPCLAGTGDSSQNWLQNGGIEILDSQNVNVYSNVLVDNFGGITVFEDSRGQSGSCTGQETAGLYCIHNVDVYDNATYLNYAPPTNFGKTGMGDSTGSDSFAQTTFENNDYCYPNNAASYFGRVASGSMTATSDASWTGLGHETGGSIARGTCEEGEENPVAPAPFFVDTLTAAAGTSLHDTVSSSGSFTWDLHAGATHGLVYSNSNRVLIVANNGYSVSYPSNLTPPSANYYTECVYHVFTSTVEQYPLCMVRLQSAAMSYYAVLYDTLNGRWVLEELNSGVLGNLTGTYTQALSNGTAYTVKILANGSAISVYVDGVLRISATDSTITAAGTPGIGDYAVTAGTDSTNIHIQSVTAGTP